jgi:TolA-binding protein
MTSMDLHPDDLLDREMRGDLSPSERDRLDAHLRQCAVCRLERLVRHDFQKEHDEDAEADVFARRLVASLIVPPSLQDDLRRPARARMRHLRLALVAAAVVSVAGWAAAARWVGAGRYVSALSLQRSETPGPAEALRTPRGGPAANDSPAVAPSDSVEAPVAAATVQESFAPSSARLAVSRTSTFAAPLRAQARDGVPGGAAAVPDPSPAAEAPPAPPPDAPGLFRRATDARRAGDHPRATHLYRALIEDYPSSSEAQMALAVLGRLLLDDADADGALRCFDQYLRAGGALREDVMLGRALSLERLGRMADEARAWSDLVSEYPSSVHAQRARRRLLELARP